jgi:hypothetical protein
MYKPSTPSPTRSDESSYSSRVNNVAKSLSPAGAEIWDEMKQYVLKGKGRRVCGCTYWRLAPGACQENWGDLLHSDAGSGILVYGGGSFSFCAIALYVVDSLSGSYHRLITLAPRLTWRNQITFALQVVHIYHIQKLSTQLQIKSIYAGDSYRHSVKISPVTTRLPFECAQSNGV